MSNSSPKNSGDGNRESEQAEGVPKVGKGHPLEEQLGAGIGMVAGGVAGAIAGPIGVAVGASLGAVVGDAAGAAMHELAEASSKRDHELDDAIGVTSGPLGANPVPLKPPTPRARGRARPAR